MIRSPRPLFGFTAATRSGRRPHFVPRLEALEDRTVPSTFLVTNLDDSGSGSLRQAVLGANDHPGADRIVFTGQAHGTITLTSGQLDVTDDLEVRSPGAKLVTVSGNNTSRVFHIAAGVTAEIDGLTITDGEADVNAPIIHSLGGGILNQGDLTLKDDVVSHNQAVGDAKDTISVNGVRFTGVGVGGGVANLGTLTVSDSTFEGNQARGASGSSNAVGNTFPGAAVGGGLANLGVATATVTECQFTSNLAQAGNGCTSTSGIAGDAGGGAIANLGITAPGFPALAMLDVTSSNFSNNQAIAGNDNRSPVLPGHALGGAIWSQNFQGSAELDVSDSTVDHNQAIAGNHNVVTPGGGGRGLANNATGGGVLVLGMGMISHSTFHDNQAIGGQGIAGTNGIVITRNGGEGRGGGICVGFPGVDVTVSNCTIDHNSAIGGQPGAGGNGGNALGGGVGNTEAGATLTITCSIIDHNQAQGGSGDTSGPASNGGSGLGGGVYNAFGSTTNVTSSSMNHNQATGGTGSDGGNGQGGGFYNAGIAALIESAIDHNQAQGGSGDTSGPASNGGDGLGGGVYNASGSTLSVTDCSITHNQAIGGAGSGGGSDGQGSGGGIYKLGTFTFDVFTDITKNHASTSNDDVYPS
jgi:hypothetical protein